MNKKILVNLLAKKFSLPISKTNEIVATTLETITKSLAKGESATFIGFGTFSVKKRKARVGRNPQNGEQIKIPAKKVVRFTAGKNLKAAIQK